MKGLSIRFLTVLLALLHAAAVLTVSSDAVAQGFEATVRLARRCMFFTPAKAECELGLRARPYIEALYDAVHWFHDAGYLQRAPCAVSFDDPSLSKGKPRSSSSASRG